MEPDFFNFIEINKEISDYFSIIPGIEIDKLDLDRFTKNNKELISELSELEVIRNWIYPVNSKTYETYIILFPPIHISIIEKLKDKFENKLTKFIRLKDIYLQGLYGSIIGKRTPI